MSPTRVSVGPSVVHLLYVSSWDIIRRHELRFQLYAGDTPFYIRFTIADWQDKAAAVRKVEHCLAEIRDSMERNYLKMNDKTIAVVATPPRHPNHGITVIKLGECIRSYSFTQGQKHRSGVRQRDVDGAASDPCLSSSLLAPAHDIHLLEM